MRTYLFLFIFVFIGSYHFHAQTGPKPFKPQELLFKGAIIYTAEGHVYENGILAVKDKSIAYVGAANNLPSNMSNWTTIDVTGKHIYPGLIALDSRLGLTEIESVPATVDFAEIGNYTPNVRAIIAYNTDSKVIPTVRSNGVLLAETAPTGGVIAGRSAVVQLDAWNWEDALLKDDAGMHINWPSMRGGFRDVRSEAERMSSYKKNIVQLEQYFNEAIHYAKATKKDRNLMLEALADCVQKKSVFFIHANDPVAIRDAIMFIKKMQLNGAIVGGSDIEDIIDFVSQEKIPVVLKETHRLPTNADSPVDQAYSLPAKLKKGGVTFAIGINDFWQSRNIAYHAGTAVGFGLSKEEALQSITASPAKIIGIYDKMGSLSIGKDATFIVSSGDVLDIKEAAVEAAFIQGRMVDLNNKQKELYHRYMTKYETK